MQVIEEGEMCSGDEVFGKKSARLAMKEEIPTWELEREIRR